ncbi:MAG: pyridoxamine 5'-phosphate oxidase family protein, partial [Chitinivibrionales bacterium]|nr:pyridoxamine 5'-phosphate oxidase family protein [Chitinivibrionales bacterium]
MMHASGSTEKLISLLHEHDLGVLATSGTEYPYTSLVTVAISDDHQYLVFPTLRETRKYANLMRDAHVSVLFDNRSKSGKDLDGVYALSVLGTAREIGSSTVSAFKERYLLRHPHLTDFVSLPQTALVHVTFTKLI